jgi:NifU-like protein involved in Fe-S cluster formation
MSATLYNRDILRLAASLVPDDYLPAPGGRAEARSPICGSRIIAEVAFAPDGTIAALALRATACALGQASAAILRANAPGKDMGTIADARQAIRRMLDDGTAADIWPELALLAPAKDYPSRHAAVLMPYDALIAAAEPMRRAG